LAGFFATTTGAASFAGSAAAFGAASFLGAAAFFAVGF
jgi:hypothetical protein